MEDGVADVSGDLSENLVVLHLCSWTWVMVSRTVSVELP
jgi:hypothetical protein